MPPQRQKYNHIRWHCIPPPLSCSPFTRQGGTGTSMVGTSPSLPGHLVFDLHWHHVCTLKSSFKLPVIELPDRSE